MLRVDLHRAQEGMVLALPVQNPKDPARPLLKMGFALTAVLIEKLDQLGLHAVWVDYPSLGFVREFIAPEVLAKRDSLITRITDIFEKTQKQATARLPYDVYTQSLVELIDSLMCNPKAALFLGDLGNGDQGLMRHSTAVTYLAVLMGLKLESYIVKERKHVDPARAKEIVSLGLGAMLHDVGIPLLPKDVQQRAEKTGDTQDPAWQEHTALGYRLIRGQIEPTAACCVLHHHQRFDGSGFAGADFQPLEGKSIHIFARIVGVADAFDRLKYPGGGEPQRPTASVLKTLLSDPIRHQFDPNILRALIEVVPPYPPGTILRLSDGSWACAVDHHPEDPCRPKVMRIPPPTDLAQRAQAADAAQADPLDLRLESLDLCVTEADGQAVAEHNFPPTLVAELSTTHALWH